MVNKKVDKSILQYCAQSLRPNLQTLKKSARNILKRKNIEDIHDLRVSSRRIRSVLEAFSDYLPNKKVKTWQKDIGIITKSFGSIRDLDVQQNIIDKIYNSVEDNKIRAGLRRIRLRINQKRQQKQEDTKSLTNSLLENASIIEMSAWIDEILTNESAQPYFSAELYQLGYKQIQTQLDAFLFYEVFIFDQARVEELHQMRISAKKLRYSLEVFSKLYNNETDFALEVARKAQEFLGKIHDNDIWIDFLPRFMEKERKRIKNFYGYLRPYYRVRPGIEYLIDNRRNKRSRLYNAFLKNWKTWNLKETWLSLRKVIFLTSIEPHPSPPDKPAPEKGNETPQEPENKGHTNKDS